MSMNQMTEEIKILCKYQACKLSYIMCMGLLVVGFLLEVYYHEPFTAVSILLISAILPSVFTYMAKSREEGKHKVIFSSLVGKYKYQRSRLIGFWSTLLLDFVILVVWRYRNQDANIESYFMIVYPSIIIFIVMSSGLACYGFYRLWIPYSIKYSKM